MVNEDLSSLFEKFNINKDSISPEMINSVMEFVNENSKDSNSSNNSESKGSFSDSIDIETIMKMKSIMDKMNISDSPRSKLLLSLKPYLKDNKKEKIDQYIQLSKIIELLPLIGGDKNGK